MSAADVLTWRQAAYDRGYRIVPVLTGQKKPIEPDWSEKARYGERPASVDRRTLSTGILCDGLRAIDIDVDSAPVVASIKLACRVLLGPAPIRVRADSPRVLLLYAAQSGEPPKRTVMGDRGKVEVLGRGQQFVAHGLHPDGCPYLWPFCGPDTVPLAALTRVSECRVSALLEAIRPILGACRPQQPATSKAAGACVRCLDRWVTAVLDDECNRIAAAPNGEQNATLNARAFQIGRHVAAGRIPRDAAEQALIQAGCRMPSYDAQRPWTRMAIAGVVRRALSDAAR